MQVINGLEEAQECATNIMATSWDKKRAFDSLSRNAARIALYRLGVPVKVCEMLVGLDIDGKTVMRTPKAKKLWDQLMLQSQNCSMSRRATPLRTYTLLLREGWGKVTPPAPSFGMCSLTSFWLR